MGAAPVPHKGARAAALELMSARHCSALSCPRLDRKQIRSSGVFGKHAWHLPIPAKVSINADGGGDAPHNKISCTPMPDGTAPIPQSNAPESGESLGDCTLPTAVPNALLNILSRAAFSHNNGPVDSPELSNVLFECGRQGAAHIPTRASPHGSSDKGTNTNI